VGQMAKWGTEKRFDASGVADCRHGARIGSSLRDFGFGRVLIRALHARLPSGRADGTGKARRQGATEAGGGRVVVTPIPHAGHGARNGGRPSHSKGGQLGFWGG